MDQANNQDVKMEESKKEEPEIQIEGKSYIGNDVISVDFMSRIRKIQKFHDQHGREKEKQKIEDSFAATLIRVIGFKEIYEAWENQIHSDVEGVSLDLKRQQSLSNSLKKQESMQIDTGDNKEEKKVGSMDQVDWIEKVPNVLCL